MDRAIVGMMIVWIAASAWGYNTFGLTGAIAIGAAFFVVIILLIVIGNLLRNSSGRYESARMANMAAYAMQAQKEAYEAGLQYAWQSSQQQSRDYNNSLQTIRQLSDNQAMAVQAAIQAGAMLYQFANGAAIALLPNGKEVEIETVEAEYWVEVAPGQVQYLPSGNQ